MKSPLLAIPFALVAGSLALQPFAFADVTYQETTQITGGSMMGMLKMAGAFSSQAKNIGAPTTSTVKIHGGRMVRSNPRTTEIIDLDAQTITSVDHDKRTYSVITFNDIQQQMAKMKAQAKGTTAPSSDASQMTFDAHITNSGATKQIDGQTATESLLTVTMTSTAADAKKAGMAATSEIWSVPDAPGLAELRAFNLRMAKELAIQAQASSMAAMLNTQPGGAQALAELQKEAAKMSGFPVLQVTRVGMTADGQPLPAPSTTPLPPAQDHGSVAGSVTQEVATSTATQTADNQIAKLGTFGRALSGSSMGALMRHAQKSSAPSAAPAAPPTAADAATAGVLMESQTQTSGFSTASVDAGSFEVPAGYKAVKSPMEQK